MNWKLLVQVGIVFISLLTVSAHGASAPADYGAQIPAGEARRTITITDSTRYVNVNKGDAVRFVVKDASSREASFTWRFDTFGPRVFQLSEIAPAGFIGARQIQVWIARSP